MLNFTRASIKIEYIEVCEPKPKTHFASQTFRFQQEPEEPEEGEATV